MSKQIINLGSGIGTHDGDGARTGGRKINENFTEVYDAIDLLISDSSIYNKIIKTTGFSLTGQNLTINANWEWILSNVGKTNPENVVINIPFCSTGKSRIEYIVPNDSNGFTRIIGAESATIPVAPQIPNEDMYVTWYTVDDGSVGVPSQPVIGDNFISKREKAAFQVYQSGEINNTVLDEFYYGYLNFRDAVTNLKSIGTYTSAYLYSGRELLIKNSQATDITIYHLTGIGFQFSFPNEVNFVLKPNEIIRFSTKILSPTSGILEYVGVVRDQISDVVGLPEALDLKLDVSAYNQHFKGSYLTEAALNAAHPTANAGDYAQVNETGSTDVVNYSWDTEESIWVNNGTGGSGATNTDALPEGSTNLYHTSARVLATLLTGISFVTGTAVTAADSVLVAFGKIQKQISDFNTTANIKSLLGITTLSGSNTGDQDLSGKQDTLVSATNIKTKGGISLLGSGDIPNSAKITTTISITNATTTTVGDVQEGKIVKIDNGVNVINYTVNGAINASFIKMGTGAITFVQGSGRTLTGANGTLVLNGAVNSTASIVSDGTVDVLYINNL